MSNFLNKTNKVIRLGDSKINPGETKDLDEKSPHVKAFVTLRWLTKVIEEKAPPKPKKVAKEKPVVVVEPTPVVVVEPATVLITEEPEKPKRGRKKGMNETDNVPAEAAPDSREPEVTGSGS